jgi:hypothetical protein
MVGLEDLCDDGDDDDRCVPAQSDSELPARVWARVGVAACSSLSLSLSLSLTHTHTWALVWAGVCIYAPR